MITEIANFRKKYPQYNDVDDAQLAGMLATKYPDAYGDLPGKVGQPGPPMMPSHGNEPSMTAGEVATGAVGNLIPSTVQMGKDIFNAVRHPIDTASAVGNVISGGAQKLMPDAVMDTIGKIPGAKDNAQSAEAMGQFFADRYGGIENVKRTIAEDPAGFLADISTVLTGGGAAAAKIPGTAGKIGKTVAAVGKAVDPVTLAGKAVVNPVTRGVAKGAERLATEGMGALTGAGPEAIRQATRGTVGFAEGLRGGVSNEDILAQAKDALSTVKQQRADTYRTQLAEIAQSNTPLNDAPIRAKVGGLMQKYGIRTMQAPDGTTVFDFSRSRIDKKAFSDAEDIINMVNDWGREADDFTPLGLDLLKQKLDDFYSESKGLSAFVTDLRNTVKQTIVKEVHQYAKMTADYERSTRFINEANRALLGGNRAMMDTAIKKLLSTQRENFEFRRQLLTQMEGMAGTDLSSQIAGATMNQAIPKGLIGKGVGTSLLYGGTVNPGLYAVAALASPRLAGEFLHNMVGIPRREVAKLMTTPEFKKFATGVKAASSRPSRHAAFQAGRAEREAEE